MIICFDDYSMNRQWFSPHAINMNRTNKQKRQPTKTDANIHKANMENEQTSKRANDQNKIGRTDTDEKPIYIMETKITVTLR